MGEEPERLREHAQFVLAVGGQVTARMARESAGYVLVLLAEVERLAGERDKLRTQKRAWENQSEANHAKCERLAGRVAALTEAAKDAVENLEGDLYLHALDALPDATFFTAVRETKDRLRDVLPADVGGSE